jgi:hypothetical protein
VSGWRQLSFGLQVVSDSHAKENDCQGHKHRAQGREMLHRHSHMVIVMRATSGSSKPVSAQTPLKTS